MKIAFCGDSFVVDTTDKSWPGLLSKEYTAEILCKGISGLSLYHAYERMMGNITEADYIIFCITDPSRLSNPFKLPITINQGMDKNAFIEIQDDKRYSHSHGILPSVFNYKELQTAVKYYYKMLYDDSHMETTHRGLLREIESVVKKYNKKCIFLKCFSESFPDYIPENVVWGNLYLYEDISMKEPNFDSNTISKDERKNHLNDKNNYNMYLFLKDIIDKDDFTPREIKMEEYFK
tara:strand:- start:476 stop:1180 length:705 start_codon:yes stop_codon:yes gene_type:complete